MNQHAPSSQLTRQQLMPNQREAPPQSQHRYRANSGAENAVAGGWAAFRPAPQHPRQPYLSSPAIAAPTRYYFTPISGTQIPGTQIPGPPMRHMPGALLYNPGQVAFQPVSLVSSAPSALGYPQARRVRCTQACNYCHKRKARCVRNIFADGSARCDNCLRDNVPCEWRQSRRRGPKRRDEDEPYGGSYSMENEARVSADFGNDWARRGVDPNTDTKSTLSVASLLNVTDDRSHATDNSEYTSSSVETTTAAYLRRPKGMPESPDTGIPPPFRPPPPCLRPAELQPPLLGNLVEEFLTSSIDEELREAVIAYYTFFYSLCPSLHPSTLLRKVVSGTLCPLLEAALRASTSVFVSRKLGRTVDTEALFSRLFSAITMRVEAPTVDEMCAFQLASMGVSSGRGFVYFDTLKTSVSTLLLQLEWHELDRYDSPRQGQPMTWDEWVERETKRRVLWISYKVDAHHAGVVGCAPIFDANQFYLRAPCSDTEWDDLSLTMLLQGSAASDSDDIASTGEAQYKTVLAVMDSLSLLFKSPSPYESFVTQLVMLQRNAKTLWTQQKSLHLRTSSPGKDIARPRLLGESQLFQRLDTDLRDWRLKLVPAESLRDPTLSPHEVCFFGDIRHKTFLLRVRYACISIYAVGMGTILHLSNRPSFFADAERQASPMDVEGASDTHKETLAVTSMLGQKFGPMWSQGLLAQDVEPESWKYCVQGAHDMADTLRRNSDIPLEHFDMVIPFALFTSITVLLRHIDQSRHKLDTDSSPGLARRQREAEWKQCLRDIKVMWRVVHGMGLIWQNGVLSGVLKLMHIDDVISAADKLEPAPPKHLPSSIFS